MVDFTPPPEEYYDLPLGPIASPTAAGLLEDAAGHIKDRAAQRDAPQGERSMARAVHAFNAMYGTALTETQGWQFMVLLKMSRASQGYFNSDDYEDQAAYAALAGESA